MIRNQSKYCFVFVCQPGELEIKSMLLAASLRFQHGNEIELVAALPEATYSDNFRAGNYFVSRDLQLITLENIFFCLLSFNDLGNCKIEQVEGQQYQEEFS